MKIKRDQGTGIVLILVGIVFGVLTSKFSIPFTAAYPGPKLLPSIGVFGFVVCGLGIFISGCRQKEEDKKFVDMGGWIRILITFAVLCLYILAMKFLGFLIVTPFVLFGLTTYFAKMSNMPSKLWVRIVFAIAVTAVLYGMYVPLFGMTLPSGSLFG